MGKWRRIGLLGLVCSAFWIAIAVVSGPALAQTEIKVGAILPLTGGLAVVGQTARAALVDALADVNEYLTENGRPFRLGLTIEDSATDPDQALAKLEALARIGVQAVIGPCSSAAAARLAPRAEALGMLLISPSSTSMDLSRPGDNLFRLAVDDSRTAKALAALLNDKGVRAVVPVWRNDDWGRALKSSLAEYFADLGGQTLAGVSYSDGQTDYSQLLTDLGAALSQAQASHGRAGTAVVVLAYDEAVNLLAQAEPRIGLDQVAWFAVSPVVNAPVIGADSKAAAMAERVGFTGPLYSLSDPVTTTPGIVLQDRAIRDRIAVQLSDPSDHYGLSAWDALWLLALSHESAGTSLSIEGLKAEFVAQAYNRVGISGVLRLNDNGDREYADFGYYTFSDRAWKLIGAYHFAYPRGESLNYLDPTVPPGLNPPRSVYRIGALLPLTGELSQTGLSLRAGLEVALESVNDHLRLNNYGTAIELVVEDTGTRPDKAVEGLNRLIAAGTALVIGPSASASVEAVMEPARQAGVLLISCESTALELALPDDNLYRFVPNDEKAAAGVVALMAAEGIKRILPLYRNDVWGRGLTTLAAAKFKEQGGEVLLGAAYDPYSRDYASALTSLDDQVAAVLAGPDATAIGAGAGADTAIFLASYEEAADIFRVAWLEGRDQPAFPNLAKVRWYGSDGLGKDRLLIADQAVAAQAAKIKLICPVYALKVGGHLIPLPLPRESTMARIGRRVGAEPSPYAYNAWDALMLGVTTLMETGWSTDWTELGPALAAASNSYIGLSNFLGLDENGDRLYGDYAYHRVKALEGGDDWELTATYHFHPNGFLPPRLTWP